MTWKVLALAGTLFLAACTGFNPAGCIACTDGIGNIHISKEITKRYPHNPDGVAFIWAHEIAHVALGHSQRENRRGPIEEAADDWANDAIIALGYNPCKVVPIMRDLELYDRANRLAKRNSCKNINDFSGN